MTFRLATIAGRATLVDGDALHDLERCSGGALGPDPMAPGDVITSTIEGIGTFTSRCV